MIKIIAQFECEVAGKTVRIYMDHDTPIAAAKEMAFAFLKHLGQIEDQLKAAQEVQSAQALASEAETKPPEEVTNVE